MRNLSKLPEIREDRGAWHHAVHGVTKSQTHLATEEQELIYNVMLVLGVQQSDSIIHTSILFFSDCFPWNLYIFATSYESVMTSEIFKTMKR